MPALPAAALRSAALLALLAALGPARAMDAEPADVASVDAIIAAYYEVVSGPAGAVPDIERDRSLHHPDAWVAIIRAGPDGARTVMRGGLDDYYGIEPGGTPPPREAGFFEGPSRDTHLKPSGVAGGSPGLLGRDLSYRSVDL